MSKNISHFPLSALKMGQIFDADLTSITTASAAMMVAIKAHHHNSKIYHLNMLAITDIPADEHEYFAAKKAAEQTREVMLLCEKIFIDGYEDARIIVCENCNESSVITGIRDTTLCDACDAYCPVCDEYDCAGGQCE